MGREVFGKNKNLGWQFIPFYFPLLLLPFPTTSLCQLSYSSEKPVTVTKIQPKFRCEKHALANSVTKLFPKPTAPKLLLSQVLALRSLINYRSIFNLKVCAKTVGGLINIRLKADSETNYFVTIKIQAVLRFEQSSLSEVSTSVRSVLSYTCPPFFSWVCLWISLFVSLLMDTSSYVDIYGKTADESDFHVDKKEF